MFHVLVLRAVFHNNHDSLTHVGHWAQTVVTLTIVFQVSRLPLPTLSLPPQGPSLPFVQPYVSCCWSSSLGRSMSRLPQDHIGCHFIFMSVAMSSKSQSSSYLFGDSTQFSVGQMLLSINTKSDTNHFVQHPYYCLSFFVIVQVSQPCRSTDSTVVAVCFSVRV